MLKIATWNVNSLRVRLPHLTQWLSDNQPDIVALQEIKLIDENFPLVELKEQGYFAVCSGQKTYNGVAILSREPGTNKITDIPGFADPQRRVLALTVGDVRVINLYIPNGESLISEKYKYKLSWLEALNSYLQEELKQHAKVVVVGDFNIAPEDRDVHDPMAWVGKVLFSAPEKQAFQAMLQQGLVDCFRLHDQSEDAYSWWDYRVNAFKRNMGLRIDHILASQALVESCQRCYIDKLPRGWERPSDHTPVIAEFS